MLRVTLRRRTGGYWRQKALPDLLTLCLTVILSTVVAVAVIVARFPRYAPTAALLLRRRVSWHVARSSFAELGCTGRRSCHRDAVQQRWQSRGLWRRVFLVG